jgi:hypothetical protein
MYDAQALDRWVDEQRRSAVADAAAPELTSEEHDRLAALLRSGAPPPATHQSPDMSEAAPATDAATATATATDVGGPRHAQNPTTVARSA